MYMAKTNFDILNPEHPIFNKLISENPEWWQILKNDSEIYIDVRKGNYLNAYYNGGSILKIKLSKTKEFEAETHYKYQNQSLNQTLKSPYIKYNLKDINLNTVASFKTAIKNSQSVESEKKIQGQMIISLSSKYLDSEFAYNDNGKLIRIDMVKLKDRKIVFEELKRIQDGRLITNMYENGEPEILSQVKTYNEFIKSHKDELKKYYAKIFKLKAKLGLLPVAIKDIRDIDEYTISDKVELFIEPYSDGKINSQRNRRIKAMKEIYTNNQIIHNL